MPIESKKASKIDRVDTGILLFINQHSHFADNIIEFKSDMHRLRQIKLNGCTGVEWNWEFR